MADSTPTPAAANPSPHSLPPASPSLPSSPSSTTPSSRKKSTGVRHGRGPLIRDSDDEEFDRDPTSVDESSPLLANGNGHGHGNGNGDISAADLERGGIVVPIRSHSRSRSSKVKSCCCVSFLTIFALALVIAAFLHLWIGHLLSTTQLDPQSGLVYSNPTAVRLTPFPVVPPSSSSSDSLTIAEAEGLLLEVDLAAAVDLRRAVGWTEDEEEGGERRRSGWKWWRAHVEEPLLRWVAREVDQVQVRVDDVRIRRGFHTASSSSTNRDRNDHDDSDQGLLLYLPRISPITLPLLTNSNNLAPITLSLPLTFPAASAIELADFVHGVWQSKKWGLEVDVESVQFRLGGMESEKRRVKEEKEKEEGTTWLQRVLKRFRMREINVNRISERIEGELTSTIPGSEALSSLFSLESYSIFPKNHTSSTFKSKPTPPPKSTIALEALVKLSNPLPLLSRALELNFGDNDNHDLSFAWHNPFSIPVGVYLPLPPPILSLRRPDTSTDQLALGPPNPTPSPDDEILLAHLVIPPFAFNKGEKKVDIVVQGELVGAERSAKGPNKESQEASKDRYSKALSSFLKTYLAGGNNTILVKYDAPVVPATELPVPGPEDPVSLPPAFLTPLLNSLEAPLIFPGSKEKMDLFENLRIENMKIRVGPGIANKVGGSTLPLLGVSPTMNDNDDDPSEGDLLCSGKVVGNIVLPDHFATLGEALNVTSILPDVFVYDGHLPNLPSPGGQPYPPSPIPATSFARLRPSSSIPSITIHYPANSTNKATTTIEASFVDAPLYLLEGRSDVLSKFLSKVIFGKTLAGARGVSGVELGLKGWGELGLEGLAVEGEFEVGM